MPWVYTLALAQNRGAETVQSDWQSIANEQVAHDHGGVTVVGLRAIVVSTEREPNYADMESFGYVLAVSEHKEIPENSDSPVKLARGFTLDPT